MPLTWSNCEILKVVDTNPSFGIVWQVEKESYVKKLKVESERVNQLRCFLRTEDTRDQEIRDLHKQLADLQVLCS